MIPPQTRDAQHQQRRRHSHITRLDNNELSRERNQDHSQRRRIRGHHIPTTLFGPGIPHKHVSILPMVGHRCLGLTGNGHTSVEKRKE